MLVGDVVHLEPGDVVPADGILIDGFNIICDESSAIGESDAIHKQDGGIVYDELHGRGQDQEPAASGLDPFLLSGTTVVEGIGTCLVTATGLNSTLGKTLASLHDDPEPTPLQQRLAVLAKYIAWSGAAFAILLFVALFIKFLATLPHNAHPPQKRARSLSKFSSSPLPSWWSPSRKGSPSP